MSSNVVREDIVRIGFEGDAFDEIKKLQKQCDTLRKKLGMVDDEPVEDVGDSAEKSNKSMEKLHKATSKVGSGLKKLAAISLKGLVTGLGAAAVGVSKLAKDSFTAYADYEQLIGGVDTLFKNASATVQANADNAFKNAGMSANEYMENVTAFSASLISSLGGNTKKAADVADMAMSDMSDNANKMGTDLNMIVGTYQSLARGNFAMLDNLKLGYGGTKAELQRLIKDAAKLDKSIKANDMSFSNIIKSIHAVQNELDITGTTQKEAEKTITGSLNMVKSAWKNLMPALINGGDSFDRCIENLIYSFDKFLDNAMPAIEKALSGIGTLIETLAPKIEEGFPVLMDRLMPPLIKAASSLLAGFIKALPGLIKTVIKEIPNIAQDLAKAIYEAFTGKEASGMENAVKRLGDTLKRLIPIIGGVVIAFKGLKVIRSIGSVFSGLFGGGKKGGSKGGIGGMLKKFANTPVKTMLKGIGYMTLIVGALGTLLWIATKVFKGGVNFTELFQAIALVGLLGGVGGALALFASVVGAIPIPVVLLGLANISLVLGGLTVLIAAFGALSHIPGFHEFLDRGGQVLVRIFQILGEMVGSLVGGAIESLSNALPLLGRNLGAFGENIRPLFSAIKGVDMGGVAAFFASLVALLGVATGNDIITGIKAFFGGGDQSPLVKLGSDLRAFVENAKPFFDSVQTIPEATFTAAKNMFEALSTIGQLPGMGGLKQMFTGDPILGMQQMANILPGLATSVNQFFANLGDRTDFSAFSALFEALSAVGQLPGFGGLAQMFLGDPYLGLAAMTQVLPGLGASVAAFFTNLGDRTDFSVLPSLFGALSAVSQLPGFGGLASIFIGDPYQALMAMCNILPQLGSSVASFFNSIGDRTDFSAIPNLFQALGSLKDYIGNEGGLFGAIGNALGGSEENALVKIGQALKQFGEDTAFFFANINSLNLANLNGLWQSLKNAETITSDTFEQIGKHLDDLVKRIEKLPQQMTTAVMSGAGAFVSAFSSMWSSALSISNSYTNRMISNINRIIRQVQSAKNSMNTFSYANGTTGHPGGNAIVNDGRGAELVRLPNGNTFIPQGRNVFLPNAPKGMQVFPAGVTAKLMGKSAPTFHYAGGTSTTKSYISNGGDTYAPVFNLTVNGDTNDRATARKVKQWVKESIDEVFSSMSRKNPRLREV